MKMKLIRCVVIITISAFLVGLSSSEKVNGIYVTSAIPDDDTSLPPIVNGAEVCGGEGFPGALRLEGCLGEGICRIPSDGQTRQAVLEFVPSRDMSSIGLRLIPVYQGSDQKAFDSGPISNSSVQNDLGYLMYVSITVAEYLVGGTTITNRFLVYDAQDPGHVDICVSAKFYIY